MSIAAAREERKKFSDYMPRVGGHPILLVPLAFETFGRWGEHAVRELRRLARRRVERPDAQQAVHADPTAVYRGCLRRWRQEASVALQLGNYAIDAACAKSLQGDSVSHGDFHIFPHQQQRIWTI